MRQYDKTHTKLIFIGIINITHRVFLRTDKE